MHITNSSAWINISLQPSPKVPKIRYHWNLYLVYSEMWFFFILNKLVHSSSERISSIPNSKWVNGNPEIEHGRSIDLTEKVFAFSGVEIIVFLSGSEIWSLTTVNGMETDAIRGRYKCFCGEAILQRIEQWKEWKAT